MNPTKSYSQGNGDEDAQIRDFDGVQPNASQEPLEVTERITREVTEKVLRALQDTGAGDKNISGRMRAENSEPRGATTSVTANSYRPRYRPILPASPRPVTQPIPYRFYFQPILPAPPQPVTQPIPYRSYFRPILPAAHQIVTVPIPASSDPVPPAPGPPVPQLTPTGRTHLPDHRPGSRISAAVPQHVKGFPCTICRRVLPSNRAFAEHIRRHNGEFACPECPASSGQPRNFSRKQILDAHRESAHGVPYTRKKGPYKGMTKAEIDAAEAMMLMQKGE